MPDDVEPVQSTDQGQQTETQTETTTPDEGGGNPNWDGLRSKLDPVTFKLIEDDLKAFDTSARTRVESVNKSYEPFKKFVDQGVTPETLEAGLNLFGQINNAPEEVYGILGKFLEENGRLPETKAEKAQVAADIVDAQAEDTDKPSAQAPSDPRLDKAMSYIERQEQAELERTAQTAIDQEIAAVKTSHPEYTDKDMGAIVKLSLAGLNERANYTIADGAKAYEELRQNILTAPRPADNAPELVPSSGGMPAAQQDSKSLGQRSSGEVQDIVANLLTKANAQK